MLRDFIIVETKKGKNLKREDEELISERGKNIMRRLHEGPDDDLQRNVKVQ